MTIKILHLSTGMEVIGEVKQHVTSSSSKYIVKRAMRVVGVPTSQGKVVPQLAPVSFTAKSSPGKMCMEEAVEIDSSQVIMEYLPMQFVESLYQKEVSGIVKATIMPQRSPILA